MCAVRRGEPLRAGISCAVDGLREFHNLRIDLWAVMELAGDKREGGIGKVAAQLDDEVREGFKVSLGSLADSIILLP